MDVRPLAREELPGLAAALAALPLLVRYGRDAAALARALEAARDRGEGLGKLVADSWPYDLPLGTQVLQAERAWRNA